MKRNELVKKLRTDAGYSVAELAETFGVDPSIIYKAERDNRSQMSLDTVNSYCDLFGKGYFDNLSSHLLRYNCGSVVKKLLDDRGIPVKEFATQLGMDADVMRNFLNGAKNQNGIPKRGAMEDELKILALYFGVDENIFRVNKYYLNKTHGFTEKFSMPQNMLKKEEEDMNAKLKKETVKAIANAGYSYSVGKDGTVSAKVSTSSDELKAQLKKYAGYCDEKDKEIEELKAQLESDKAHVEFYEKRFREVDAQCDILKAELLEKNKLITELSEINTSLKKKQDTVDYGMAKDLRDATAELTKYKDILLKMLLERYNNEVG